MKIYNPEHFLPDHGQIRQISANHPLCTSLSDWIEGIQIKEKQAGRFRLRTDE